jgi:hypothetical protein
MKKLLILLLLISNLVIAQEKIVPLTEYTTSNIDWQSNLYDVYYVACRCGFAYQAAYEEMQKHTEDEVDTYFHDRGYVMIMSMADYLTDNADEKSFFDKKLENQMEAIFAFYQDEASKSYIENNKFNGIIGKDILTCKDYESFYNSLNKKTV